MTRTEPEASALAWRKEVLYHARAHNIIGVDVYLESIKTGDLPNALNSAQFRASAYLPVRRVTTQDTHNEAAPGLLDTAGDRLRSNTFVCQWISGSCS